MTRRIGGIEKAYLQGMGRNEQGVMLKLYWRHPQGRLLPGLRGGKSLNFGAESLAIHARAVCRQDALVQFAGVIM